MIMQGNTPRSLSWVGALAVVGLGLVLLPLGLARGQQDEDPAPRNKKAPPAKDAPVYATPKDQDAPVALPSVKKYRLKGSEDADAEGAPRTQKEAKALQAAAADLEKLIAQKKAELQALEAKRGAALDQLKKMQAGDDLPAATAEPKHKFKPDPKAVYGAPRTATVPAWAPKKAGQSADLEKKLDRLLQEVEELRREMRGGAKYRTPSDYQAK